MLTNININKSKRLQQLNELKVFESECQKSINDILSELEWNSSHLNESEEMVLCPFDSNHRMPQKYLIKHLEKCELRSKDYRNIDIESVPPSSLFYYQKSPHIRPVIIDKQIQEKILESLSGWNYCIQIDVPFCNDRSRIELSAEQRLAIYDSVISSTKANFKCSDSSQSHHKADDESLRIDLFEALNKTEAQKSGHKETADKREMLAMQRNMKRRRHSYRAKSVHTSRKSYLQILRDVIENHCKSLESRSQSKSDNTSDTTQSRSRKHKTHKTHKTHKHKNKDKSKDRT